jgi:hypothetical protein
VVVGQHFEAYATENRKDAMKKCMLYAPVLAALFLAGCGGPSEAQRVQNRADEFSKLTPVLQTRLAGQAQGVKQACTTAIGGLIDEVTALNSRLDIGMTYADYSSKVADANVAYDRIDSANLTGGCFDAAVAAEKALNQYISASGVWDTCIQDDYCTTDSIETELQAYWLKASGAAEKAKRTLDGVGSGLTVGSRAFPLSDTETDGTVYGTIERLVCSPPDPPATEKPCKELRNLIAGGVEQKERAPVDEQVRELVKALGLNPS